MIDIVFVIKFVVAVGSVVGISELFERMNPKIAGVLSGYPVGVALSLFFFGFENGPEFAARSALFNIVGISTFLAFIAIYYAASKYFIKWSLFFSTLLATVGFLAISYYLQPIEFSIAVSVVIALSSIFILQIVFNKIRKVETGLNVKTTFKSLFTKAFVAGSIITGVTTIAKFVGPEWAGLLASFPATTLPLMLMVHHKYSAMHLHALVKYIPISSVSIVGYVLAVYYLYPTMGIYLGTLASYAVATAPILLLYYVESNNLVTKIRKAIGMADKDTIHFIITGGTIDFHYARKYDTVIPNKKSVITEFMKSLEFIKTEFTELFIKDSRNLTDADFSKILKTIENSVYKKIVVTTGTFKIDKLAQYVDKNLKNHSKTIIFTGSTTPIQGFTPSEGLFNLGHAVASVNLRGGVYISFNGELFSRKDIDRLVREGGLSAIFQIGINSTVV